MMYFKDPVLGWIPASHILKDLNWPTLTSTEVTWGYMAPDFSLISLTVLAFVSLNCNPTAVGCILSQISTPNKICQCNHGSMNSGWPAEVVS